MSESTGSILNHFKRKLEDEGAAEAPSKRAHTSAKNDVKPPTPHVQNKEFRFVIEPPDFDLEVSKKPGREVKKKPDLDLVVFKPFLAHNSAKVLYKYLLDSLPWYKVLPVMQQ
jgi:hypothetical protein